MSQTDRDAGRQLAKEMHADASKYQVHLQVNLSLPVGWFVAELYQPWNTALGYEFYRYPGSKWTCRLESTKTSDSAIGEDTTFESAIAAAIKVARKKDQVRG